MAEIDIDYRMPFGKYRGNKLKDVLKQNRKYIDWLLDQDIPFVFRQQIEIAISEEIDEIIEEIKELRTAGEKVYYQNIHCVGYGLIIGNIHLEEVANQLYISGAKCLTEMTKLNKLNFDRIYAILKEYNVQDGQPSKDRGLY